MGKDFTLFAKTEGIVQFEWFAKNKKRVSVKLPQMEER
jgi:ribosomal protein L27